MKILAKAIVLVLLIIAIKAQTGCGSNPSNLQTGKSSLMKAVSWHMLPGSLTTHAIAPSQYL